MKALPTLLVLWCLAISSQACVWIKGTTKEGKRVETSGLGAHRNIEMRLRNSLGTDLRAEGEELERKLRGASSFDDRNDYAVALMYLGRAPEAVELLRGLETEKPGEYATAANLGTALELAGNNPEALRWIREGVRRNAKSHEGTEWLHVKILEAKINSQKDPGYFGSHSVLNLDPATLNAEEKRVRMDGKDWEVSKLTEALQYQLIERTKFVKKNDPAVASLFFDYAALERAMGTLEAAKGLLQMAIDFGYPADPARKIMEQYDAVIRRAVLATKIKIAGGSLLGIAFIAYAFKRKWIVFSRASVRSHRSAEVS